jgi:eukaryotic-like serine/threonine-protein kinase
MGTAPLQVGDLVAGKYRLDGELGTGGMGVVYAATHTLLDQKVALKFLFADAAKNPELVERFWREARAAVKIQSEHVARVMDIGEANGVPYMVMEYLEGDDLENIVKRHGPLPVADAIRFVLQACEALAEVHAHGIVHRDIKPANLFLAARPDGTNIVKLLDFGISKVGPAWLQTSDALTNTAAVIGSPRYMSPEQLRSSRDVDLRADIWALGVTLFEVLGGDSPFARGTMPEVCASILKDEPHSLTGLRPGIPPALEAVIRRCLAKEPDGRYRNVAELAMALRPFGPHGIIDISIERVVGIVQMSMMSTTATTPPPMSRRKTSTAPTRHESKTAPGRTDEELEKHYWGRIGPRKQVPRVAMQLDQITSLSVDHRTGFLLSLVDGTSTIDDLLDVSGMAHVETLRLICELLDAGVLVLTPTAGRAK